LCSPEAARKEFVMSRRIKRIVCATALAAAVAWLAFPAGAVTNWGLGYLFIGTGAGTFQVRNNAGVLQESISAVASGTPSGVTGGCALDGSLNVYLVNTTQERVIKRALASPHGVIQLDEIETGVNPQSVVVASNGDVFVGHKGGLIRRYNQDGDQQDSFPVTVDTSDSLWMDLAADQQTLFYTSGGRTIRTIKTNGTGAGQFGQNLPGNLPQNKASAIRLLAPLSGSGNDFTRGIRGAIVADGNSIKRLDSVGAVVKTYDFGSGSAAIDNWVAVGLDPKDVDELGADRAFWAGDFATGRVFRFNVSSGAVDVGGITPVSVGINALSGMCLNGEPTVGQFTGVLNLTPTTPSGTVVFASGTPAVEEHSFGIAYGTLAVPVLTGPVNVAVNAREVESDGVCTSGIETDRTDVDCGFKKYFLSDPQLPKGAAYAHGRSVYYRVIPSQGNLGQAVVTISSEKSFNTILTEAGNCIFDPDPEPDIETGRAMRILRDPVDTEEDQFQFDVLESFFIDEFGGRTKVNRFMAAFRCSQGFSEIQKPEDGRTFSSKNAIPIEMFITDANGDPVNSATTAPHHMVATVGTVGQVLFALGTPGNSPNFFNSIGNGTYIASLQVKGLKPSPTIPYVLCITDSIDIDPLQTVPPLPLYPQQCVTFFLR
jgi:hypothetical protein